MAIPMIFFSRGCCHAPQNSLFSRVLGPSKRALALASTVKLFFLAKAILKKILDKVSIFIIFLPNIVLY
jgi:hypothetical protein